MGARREPVPSASARASTSGDERPAALRAQVERELEALGVVDRDTKGDGTPRAMVGCHLDELLDAVERATLRVAGG